MRDKKTWLKAIVELFVITVTISAFFLYRWDSFTPIAMKDSAIEVKAESMKDGAGKWIQEYMKQYKKIFVPFSMRVNSIEIESIEALDEHNFYQVDYIIHTSSTNWQLSSNLEAMETGRNTYKAQRVLELRESEDGYQVVQVLSPVQYQIQFELDPSDIPQPLYAMQDKEQTYLLQNEKLQVTYDHGKTFHEVPIRYEDITRVGQSAYTVNLLQEGSYLVDKAYTAFLYRGEDRSLKITYSIDEGKTWETSVVAQELSQRVRYLSKTENYVYILTASNKAMSAEGHVLYYSRDLKNFELVNDYQDPQVRLMTYATFIDDQTLYVSYVQQHFADSSKDDVAIFYRSNDGGRSFTPISLPKHEVTVLDFTYAPFVQVEKIYQEENEIYVVVNQGDHGDYGTNQGLYKALYKSSDGYQFTFVKEFIDEPVLAG